MSDRSVLEAYWENPNTVSLIDENLRKLETEFVLSNLGGQECFGDLGCGAAESTVYYAQKVKHCIAIEQSSTLRKKAQEVLSTHEIRNVDLIAGDVRDLAEHYQKFDAVLTQRVVINFMSWPEQQAVLDSIAETLKPGGIYICIENTFEGFEEMNKTRRAIQLDNIKLHDWHNHFLFRDEFLAHMQNKFALEKTQNFNLYYLLTRVFLNMFASFDGFGINAKKDEIFSVADHAARQLHNIYNHKLTFALNAGDSFGPIQGFIFRKRG